MHALKAKALSGKHARLTIGGGGEYIDAVCARSSNVLNLKRKDSRNIMCPSVAL